MEEFNEAMFKTKVDNIFVKLYTSVMKGDLSTVSHFIGDSLEKTLQEKINNLKEQNQRQIYDELNVKDTQIINRIIKEDKELVEVKLISRYMDYIIDIDTGELVSGDDSRRIEKVNILTFEKKINTKEIGIVRKCLGCGASISVNTSGKCAYCDRIYDQEKYDYVLISMIQN